MPGIPLRRRLLALAAAGIVPIAAMSAIGFYLLLRQQQVQAERVGLELARALATAVDAELRSSTSVLEALATTAALDRNDTSGFRERAQRVLNTQPNWAAVLLADPAGHRLMDTRFASPAPQPLAEPLSFDTVVRTRAPAVGNLAKGLRRQLALSGAGAGASQRRVALCPDGCRQARGNPRRRQTPAGTE